MTIKALRIKDSGTKGRTYTSYENALFKRYECAD